jgi:hypothetical protein
MRRGRREARAVQHVAYLLGVRCVRSRPPLVVTTGNLANVATGVMCLRRIIHERCDRTFAIDSQRPALIRKTIETIVAKNEMVKKPDAQ